MNIDEMISAIKFVADGKREICDSYEECEDGCSLKDIHCCLDSCSDEDLRKIIKTIEEWQDDRKLKRVCVDEVVHVYTMEITKVFEEESTPEKLREIADREADILKTSYKTRGIVEYDDVRCIRAQQFAAKWHEEET